MENFFNKLLGKKTEAIKEINPEEHFEHLISAETQNSNARLEATQAQLQKELEEIQSEHENSKLTINQRGELEENI